jgi:hypothetical protein
MRTNQEHESPVHSQKIKAWVIRADGTCRKKLQPEGCFEYDKVITVRRFSP